MSILTRQTSDTDEWDIALWAVQVLLAVLFAFAGLVKLVGLQAEVDAFTQTGLGQWFR